MTIESFQRFVETFCPTACVPVDLVKIARNVLLSNAGPRVQHDFRYHPAEINPSPFCLVMDGECCLNRLYGGYFGDWVCGGQWNRMVDFLRTFFRVVNKHNMEITIFFNGTNDKHRFNGWVDKQKSEKEKIAQVLRHTSYKGTPPPKVWWIPPHGIETCLRALLRHLKVNVVVTTNDHHQEVMTYLKKHSYHGLLADDPEYIAFDPPRYFSSVQLKLTFKGCLETKEYVLNEVTRSLNLHPSRISIVAALLGNHILSESDLTAFHRSICPNAKRNGDENALVKAVVDYVKNLQSVDDLATVASQVFGVNQVEKCDKFRQCVLYYSGVSRNDLSSNLATFTKSAQFMSKANKPLFPAATCSTSKDIARFHENQHQIASPFTIDTSANANRNKDLSLSSRSKFASETDENEISNLQSFHQVLGKARHNTFDQLISNSGISECDGSGLGLSGTIDLDANHKEGPQSSSVDVSQLESSMSSLSLKPSCKKTQKSQDIPPLPKVCSEVLGMSKERHQKGLMHPYIYQILTQGEIRIPVTFEDDTEKELPSPTLLYRPLRQMVYALLFNQHHLQWMAEQKMEKGGIAEKIPEIAIKEWVWSKSNKYAKPDRVPSLPLGWKVPTVVRLWFGAGPDENKKRLQAFLTIMRSNAPSMSDPLYVPQHLIILCSVLRYLLSCPGAPFLLRHELDAFLVQAVDARLMDTEYTQNLEITQVTARGVMLAAMFMTGVDHAIMANDACGAPISWLMCCPWLFFDGKLFHHKLLKANAAKNLMDLCDNRFEEVAIVERMRTAIFEGLTVKFRQPQVLSPHGSPLPQFSNYPIPVPPLSQGRGQLFSKHQRVVPRGGQLEVAGVVVGSWGPNYGQGPSPSRNVPPQIVSVGGVSRGRVQPNNVSRRGLSPRGRTMHPRGQSSPGRPRNSSRPTYSASPLGLSMGRGTMVLETAKE